MLRDYDLGEVDESLIGKKVRLVGWADTIREHGNVTFIDLRDRYGKVQCVIIKKNSDFEEAKKLTTESCVQIEGQVNERPKGTENKELGSGKVEIFIDKLEILSLAEPLPFELGKDDVNEDLRLRYRYLDLRRPAMVKNLELRHKMINFIRNYLDEKKFLEVTTPMLTKSTPEGARDFIVPSRLHPGKFYALPQSPQQYKQLLMVAGIDKYFQIAPCFRDEDARADRSPGEFYQLDMEMSFVDQKDILDLVEEMMLKLVKELLPDKKLTFDKFPRLSYDEVMKKYGTDKPDLRKNKEDPNELAFAWIVDFPLFEEEKTEGNYAPMHHMFTQPKADDLRFLNKKNAHKVKSYQHDLVLNGFEVGGGSVRIHDAEIQKKIFDLIGFSDEQKKYFEHMLTAFKYGVPPHGGIAPGIDRLIMVLLGQPSLREVIAFPKNKEAKDVLMDAPSFVDKKQLKDVSIKSDLPKKEKR
ncbi:aspartate--tRNA ligase [archaeon]|jgi:aspartyl-tRNA synthetase|nr:aspartate--tRNA ligase [archaeon]MBT4373804.1 aspartate--tRNA ligase [archaeon]MBT4532270.1 aspartate--tRNA ligase [archaeon]MBT7001095.1 aspartate--tRNA ligase [archaeon]MBT7281984.1 aspartate--tRNA ligase [archaeon]